MKIYITLLFTISFLKGYTQTTLIPDPVFEQHLITKGIDTDGLVNGQMLTADALAVTQLTLGSPQIYVNNISNLAGIEAFTNLEKLEVYGADLYNTGLNIVNLNKLIFLALPDCRLKTVDVSQSLLLEEIYLSNSAVDVGGNSINNLDLSNNPLVHKIGLKNNPIQSVNLKNNTQTNVLMDLDIEFMNPLTSNYIICIEVDDEIAAINKQGIYTNWQVIGPSTNSTDLFNYIYSKNCALSKPGFDFSSFKIYPNPTIDVLQIDYDVNKFQIKKLQLFSTDGKKLKEISKTSTLDISFLNAGNYILKIETSKGSFSKLIIKK
ncbi:MAG: T9SS type A sorting domain-containing protein [Myroides sp.]